MHLLRYIQLSLQLHRNYSVISAPNSELRREYHDEDCVYDKNFSSQLSRAKNFYTVQSWASGIFGQEGRHGLTFQTNVSAKVKLLK